MANINYPFGFRPVRKVPPMERGVLAASVALKEGDPLKRQADGTISTAALTDKSLLGFAAYAVDSSTSTQEIVFYPAVKDAIFEARALTGRTVDLTEAYGALVGFTNSAAGAYVKFGTTNTVFRTVGIHPHSTLGASLAVVQVVVIQSQWEA